MYIFGMQMSQRIHFWYQILLKIKIFWKQKAKNHLLVKKKVLNSLQKKNELKMLKLLESYVKKV